MIASLSSPVSYLVSSQEVANMERMHMQNVNRQSARVTDNLQYNVGDFVLLDGRDLVKVRETWPSFAILSTCGEEKVCYSRITAILR
jgi:hypothetical protein